jgi:SAM-dependent methyltransferase
MGEPGYGQQPQMEDDSMRRTLRSQAEMIWPLERPLLDAAGLGACTRVADLGCGTGEFAGRVAEAWPRLEIVGIDLFEGHLAHARARWPAARHPGLRFERGDARATGLPAEHVDAVTIRHLLQALPDVDRVLAEARRILRPGGLLHVLAEDYAGLLFDVEDVRAQRLFLDATPGLRAHGTNLLQGRAAQREVLRAGFVDVRVTPVVVDTSNSERATLARMLRAWRDGYASLIAEANDLSLDDVRARFDALAAGVQDPERYACWLLFAVDARRPPLTSAPAGG